MCWRRWWTKSERALIARVVLVASFAPAHVITDRATLARLDFGRASPNLPTFAQLFSVHKNLTVIGHLDSWTHIFVLAFAMLALSI